MAKKFTPTVDYKHLSFEEFFVWGDENLTDEQKAEVKELMKTTSKNGKLAYNWLKAKREVCLKYCAAGYVPEKKASAPKTTDKLANW